MSGLQESIAAGYKIIQDANLHDLSDTLECKLSNTSAILQKNLALATLIKPSILIKRQKAIIALRDQPRNAWEAHFSRIAEIEKDILPFFKKSSDEKDSLEDDAIAQLSFQDDLCKPLNQVPWMICCIALFKVWVVPALTLMTPILAWIVPYILLKFVYAFPIEQQEYINVLQGMWVGNMGMPGGDIPDMLSPRSIIQFVIFAISFIQGMVQPIQNAMHLNKTDTVIVGVGQKLVELRDFIRSMKTETSIPLTNALDEIDGNDYRRIFMLIKEQPERLHMALRDLAELEIVWRFSLKIVFKPVIFKPAVFVLRQMVDISLKDGIPSSLALTETTERHAVITGPNGGGKSSFLRATLQSVLIGHSYGMAACEEAIMPRFKWIASGLQLRDTPGRFSMFETEVKFAADCIRLARLHTSPGLVLFDELFHSTNPPDGALSASIFLKQLWGADSNAFSVVSTHVFPLVEKKPKNVQAICCPATQNTDGTVSYSYKAEPGICKVSSVHMVWEKYGLTCGYAPAAKVSVSKRNTQDAI